MLSLPYICLGISTLLLIILGVYIVFMKDKNQLHYAFLLTILFMLFYNLASIFEKLFILYYGYNGMLFARVAYFGFSFLPISFLFVGKIFSGLIIKMKQIIIWGIIPIFTNIVLWFFIKQFFIEYNGLENLNKYGFYNNIHVSYSYICLGLAFYYFIKYSIKKSGIFSKQAVFILGGSSIPLILNIQFTLAEKTGERIISNNLDFLYSPYITPISFSLAIVCFTIGILKFEFLKLSSTATEVIVNNISDCYIVVDSNFKITNFNEVPFKKSFENAINFKVGDSIKDVLEKNKDIPFTVERFNECVSNTVQLIETEPIEWHIEALNKWFKVEFTATDNKRNSVVIILFKDITDHKNYIEQQEEHQKILTEQERLATLGELSGGMAHDINNPLSVIQKGLKFIGLLMDDLSEENISIDERNSIISQCKEQFQNSSLACSTIAEIVNSILNHTRNLSDIRIEQFYISDIIENIKIMTNHKLMSSGCQLIVNEKVRELLENDPGKLSQVLTNLLLNAIQAYDEKPGKIEMTIEKIEDDFLISVRDFAGGIPEAYRDGIFKKILTTKGTKGTGLGLYVSRSITKTLGGSIRFETKDGVGTVFYILLPTKNISVKGEE